MIIIEIINVFHSSFLRCLVHDCIELLAEIFLILLLRKKYKEMICTVLASETPIA